MVEPSTCILVPPQDVTPAAVTCVPAEVQVPRTETDQVATPMETLATKGPTVQSGDAAESTVTENHNAPDLTNHGRQETLHEGSSLPKRSIQDISAPQRTITKVDQPYGIAINSKGEILVAELGAKCISVYSPEGHKLRSFGEAGSGTGRFRGCKRVAVDHEDNIFVTDHSHTVQKFTADGHFVATTGKKGAESLQFNYPAGIRVHPITKNVYVCDLVNHRIQILNFDDLTFYGSFGKSGSGGGEFNCPMDVAFDSHGNVYISDYQNHRIQVFTPEGELLRNIGKPGSGSGELYLPSGLHVNDSHVYVAEEANHRISVFTTEGLFITSFGRPDSEERFLKQPMGVAVDSSGLVYVSDHSNNCVYVF